MKGFKEYLAEEDATPSFREAVQSVAGEEREFPHRTKTSEYEHHGFLDKEGNYFSINHYPDTHSGASHVLAKDIPNASYTKDELASPGKHASKRMSHIMQHYKVARVFISGNDININTHHPLSTPQKRVLNHAIANGGYNWLNHDQRGEYNFADKHNKIQIARVLRMGAPL